MLYFFNICKRDLFVIDKMVYHITNIDGDQVSIKPCLTIESNQDAEKRLTSNAYLLNVEGKLMRGMSKDFILTAYNLTNGSDSLPNANAKAPLFNI